MRKYLFLDKMFGARAIKRRRAKEEELKVYLAAEQ